MTTDDEWPRSGGHMLACRDGWTLTRERVIPGDQRVQFALRGLRVTPDQADAILKGRPGPYLGDYRGEPPYSLTLAVTWEESEEIRRGADPLAMLLPRLRVRALTAEEMTAA